jgi:hypothetical protein
MFAHGNVPRVLLRQQDCQIETGSGAANLDWQQGCESEVGGKTAI